MRLSLLSVAAGVLLATAPMAQELLSASDVPSDATARAQAEEFRKLTVPKRQVRANVRKLTRELTWHRSLQAATSSARKLDRPVLWIQALGNVKGYT